MPVVALASEVRPVKLFIVEDDPLLRDNLRQLLGGERDLEIVGVASDARQAQELLPDAGAELLLCDLGLPDMDGTELIRWARERLPGLEVLAHTVFEDRDTVFKAIRAGAMGYLLKDASPRELVEALVNLEQGGAPMSPRIARAVLRELHGQPVEQDYLLTAQERRVLGAIDRGLTYKETAGELGLSPHTIHSHIKKAYEKLQAHGKRDALIKARKRGLL